MASTIKPDSQKTYTEKTTEQVKGKSDGIARHAQPSMTTPHLTGPLAF